MATSTADKTTPAASDLRNSSAFRCATHAKLSPAWQITQDLWGSPLDIRNQGQAYLSKFKKEPSEKYEERRSNSVFMNEFRGSIETMAGMVFRTDPRPEGVDPSIDVLMPDIDLCGNSFWAFNLSGFEKFLRDGNGFIYIDAPPVSEEVAAKVAEGAKPTLRDRANDRAYWVFYSASQIINYRYAKEGSRSVLAQVTIEEKVMEPDGLFGEKEVVKHRVLRPGSFEVLIQDASQEFTVRESGGTTGLDHIPLIPITDLGNQPPMLTLALLNVLHYNQTSDYDNMCHLVCTPQQVRRYDKKEDAEAASKMAVASPGVGIRGWGEYFDVKYAEVEGKGMQLSRDRYHDVEKQMARIGIGMLEPSDVGGVRTATEVMDTASQRQSKLANLTRQWQNAVEKALYMTAEVINVIKGKNTINLDDEEKTALMRLKIDYERLTFTLDQLKFFSDLVDSGKLSLQTFLEWLPQVADMPPKFDPETELKRIVESTRIVARPKPVEVIPGEPPVAEPPGPIGK